MSPGTRVAASTVLQAPSRSTVASRREALLQRGQRVGRLAVLPEVEHRVEDEEADDDDEVRPVAEDRRDDRGGLDHEGDRADEAAQDLLRRSSPHAREDRSGRTSPAGSAASATERPWSGLTASVDRTCSSGALLRASPAFTGAFISVAHPPEVTKPSHFECRCVNPGYRCCEISQRDPARASWPEARQHCLSLAQTPGPEQCCCSTNWRKLHGKWLGA